MLERETPAAAGLEPWMLPSENPSPVKDSWFHSYIKAKSYWPQDGAEAWEVFILSGIMSDPPEDFGGFATSEVSDRQLFLIGNTLNSWHHVYGVEQSADVGKSADFEKPCEISTEDLAGLWRGAKFITLSTLLNSISGGNKYNVKAEFTSEEVDSINSFLSDDKNLAEVTAMKKSFSAGGLVAQSSIGIALSEIHRAQYFGDDDEGREKKANRIAKIDGNLSVSPVLDLRFRMPAGKRVSTISLRESIEDPNLRVFPSLVFAGIINCVLAQNEIPNYFNMKGRVPRFIQETPLIEIPAVKALSSRVRLEAGK
jgi:hypothetical protein